MAESNGSLLPGLWCDSLHVTCGLTACTPGSAPGPTLGNEYGKTLRFLFPVHTQHFHILKDLKKSSHTDTDKDISLRYLLVLGVVCHR